MTQISIPAFELRSGGHLKTSSTFCCKTDKLNKCIGSNCYVETLRSVSLDIIQHDADSFDERERERERERDFIKINRTMKIQ